MRSTTALSVATLAAIVAAALTTALPANARGPGDGMMPGMFGMMGDGPDGEMMFSIFDTNGDGTDHGRGNDCSPCRDGGRNRCQQ